MALSTNQMITMSRGIYNILANSVRSIRREVGSIKFELSDLSSEETEELNEIFEDLIDVEKRLNELYGSD